MDRRIPPVSEPAILQRAVRLRMLSCQACGTRKKFFGHIRNYLAGQFVVPRETTRSWMRCLNAFSVSCTSKVRQQSQFLPISMCWKERGASAWFLAGCDSISQTSTTATRRYCLIPGRWAWSGKSAISLCSTPLATQSATHSRFLVAAQVARESWAIFYSAACLRFPGQGVRPAARRDCRRPGLRCRRLLDGGYTALSSSRDGR